MLLGLASESAEPAEAADWFRKVIEAEPQYLDARLGLARAQARQGEVEAAIAGYYTVLTMAPGNADAYRALADLYRERGDAAAARVHAELAERFHHGAGTRNVR